MQVVTSNSHKNLPILSVTQILATSLHNYVLLIGCYVKGLYVMYRLPSKMRPKTL